MSALYLDSSAFVKVIADEAESAALRAMLAASPAVRVSSSLLRTEAMRATRHLGPLAMAAVRDGLRRMALVPVDDLVLDAAGILEPRILRALDAIHLSTALALGDDLEAVVTYDGRMIAAAALLGLPTLSPR